MIGGKNMGFSKTFPRQIPGSNFPIWEEVTLSDEEETAVEDECRRENIRLLTECISDAKSVAIRYGINTDENAASLAIALFEKRASHAVYWKEGMAKEKFDSKN